jgi:hypothetical protein
MANMTQAIVDDPLSTDAQPAAHPANLAAHATRGGRRTPAHPAR